MWPRRPGWSDSRPGWFDGCLAVAGTAVVLGDGAPGSPWVRVPAVVAIGVAAALARSAPVPAAGTAFCAVTGSALLGASDQQLGWLLLVYVALAATAGASARDTWLVAPLSVAGPLLAEVLAEPGQRDVVFALIDYGGTVTMGMLLGQQRRRAVALERRTVELTGERDAAVTQERRRLARELHDIVSHGVALMVVQASVAELMLSEAPNRAVPPLHAVQDTGREALGELHRLLSVLSPGGAGEDERAPTPLLADVPRLVDRFREAGVTVDLAIGELPEGLPASLQLAAYRVVQESLTNTVRYAQGSTARVDVHATVRELVVEVTDTGRSPLVPGRVAQPGPAGGRGLAGLRERVGVYGGHLEAGPRGGGGYLVAAALPLTAS